MKRADVAETAAMVRLARHVLRSCSNPLLAADLLEGAITRLELVLLEEEIAARPPARGTPLPDGETTRLRAPRLDETAAREWDAEAR